MALVRLLLLLSSLFAVAFSGPGMDPNGGNQPPSGSCIDPLGGCNAADGGGAMDPNGLRVTSDEGNGFDPHGKP